MIPLCLLRQEKGTRKGRGRGEEGERKGRGRGEEGERKGRGVEEKYIIPEGNN